MTYTYMNNPHLGDYLWDLRDDVADIFYSMPEEKQIDVINAIIGLIHKKDTVKYTINSTKDVNKLYYTRSISSILETFDPDFYENDKYMVYDGKTEKVFSFSKLDNWVLNILDENENHCLITSIWETIVDECNDLNMPEFRKFLKKINRRWGYVAKN